MQPGMRPKAPSHTVAPRASTTALQPELPADVSSSSLPHALLCEQTSATTPLSAAVLVSTCAGFPSVCALPVDDFAAGTVVPPHSWDHLVIRLGQEVARWQSTCCPALYEESPPNQQHSTRPNSVTKHHTVKRREEGRPCEDNVCDGGPATAWNTMILPS